ncbi:hypothetical protein PsorP6_001252 [Peronosclerospora sorghi]|uniref:Uncharacterized protein n=1 Tax=Peronosclerospora sorghi TaxID=230839 RepID=A0ACC0WWQ9_9STRA|nr:hypothetical protein PsorP6_001252 [Peronosclerospora sorghi]
MSEYFFSAANIVSRILLVGIRWSNGSAMHNGEDQALHVRQKAPSLNGTELVHQFTVDFSDLEQTGTFFLAGQRNYGILAENLEVKRIGSVNVHENELFTT